MTPESLVSIITPTYNHAGYIADCIRSVLQQSYPHWEMIIVDDGSTDHTLQTAREWAARDARIRVYTQPNVGIFRLQETYNFALGVAQGQYLAVLEGDDVWTPHKLALQVKAMEECPQAVLCWGMAYTSTADLSDDYELYPKNDRSLAVYNNQPLHEASKHLVLGCFIAALTVMVRRDALLRVGGFLQPHHLPLVDLPTWQQLSLVGRFVYLPQVLGRWRIYPAQVTKTFTVDIVEGFHRLALDFVAQCGPLGIFTDRDLRGIDRHFMNKRVECYARSGRYKLIRGDFQGARRDYASALLRFGLREPVWKVRALIGIIFSWCRADVEGVARRLGRVSYR